MLVVALSPTAYIYPVPGGHQLHGTWPYTDRKHATGQTRFTGQGYKDHDAEDEHVFRTFFSAKGQAPFVQNGTFVEMGAFNGVTFSNTLFFERELGWRGLLVEPSEYYEDLVRVRGANASVKLSYYGNLSDPGSRRSWRSPTSSLCASIPPQRTRREGPAPSPRC